MASRISATVLIVQILHDSETLTKPKINIGMLADFTMLSAGIMKIPEPEILNTRCVMTVIGGEIVYENRQ